MSDRPSATLSMDDARKVAELARLRLSDAELDALRDDLSAILGHAQTLESINIEGVEPMAHPIDMSNRFGDDEPVPGLPVDAVLSNAPETRDRYLSVPKVLGTGDGA